MVAPAVDDDRGIKAIIALQAAAGITETHKQAKKGWNGMSAHAREHTLLAANAICPDWEKKSD